MKTRALSTFRGAPAVRRKSTFGSWLGQTLKLNDARFWGSFFGNTSWAGESVTPQRAMQISAVWRAVQLTATTLATLPKGLFTTTSEGPTPAPGGPTDALMSNPNDEQTASEFWEQILGCQELVGNGMARKLYVGNRVVAMLIMDPMRTRLERTVTGYQWRYTDDHGREVILAPSDVFHVRGFSLFGPVGMSTVSYGAQTMGLALAAEKTAGKLFASGMRNSGFVNTGQVLNEPDRKRMDTILAEYTGSDKAGGIMLLEGGMTYTPISMSAQDAELLLTRKFEIEEIGRWFGMPPILLGHAVDGQTMWGSGVDAIIQAWLTLGLNQRIVRIEDAWKKRVMTPGEAARYYPRWNADALLRVNSLSRIQFLASAVQNGLMDRDEGREKLELGKRPGGDKLTVQVNLAPLDQLGETSAADVAAASALKAAGRRFLGIEDAPEPADLLQ